jgi:hypothetical protein
MINERIIPFGETESSSMMVHAACGHGIAGVNRFPNGGYCARDSSYGNGFAN